MLGAVVFGHERMQAVINAINEFVDEAGKPEWDWAPAAKNEELVAKLNALVEADLRGAYRITSKQQRTQRINEISAKAVEALTVGEGAPDAAAVGNLFFEIESRIVRGRILAVRRAAYRWSRYPHGSSDRHSLQRVAAHPRFRPVYPRRNASTGGCHAWHRS